MHVCTNPQQPHTNCPWCHRYTCNSNIHYIDYDEFSNFAVLVISNDPMYTFNEQWTISPKIKNTKDPTHKASGTIILYLFIYLLYHMSYYLYKSIYIMNLTANQICSTNLDYVLLHSTKSDVYYW